VEPLGAQQACDTLLSDEVARVTQIAEQAWRPVRAVGSRVRGANHDGQFEIASSAR
jgi:hypothetical protein